LKADAMAMEIRVECYAGYKADERPLGFVMPGAGGRRYEVREVVDQWYGPGTQCFKVRADDGNFYILRHDFDRDGWTLVSFREGEKQVSEDRSQESE
jgi:hypothetical protein